MPILVNKIYLCDTENMDEAYDWTKPTHEKVETFQVGQMRSFDPNAPQGPQRPSQAPQRPPLAPVQNLPPKPTG